MLKIGISRIDKIIRGCNSVELEGNWLNNIQLLARIINYTSRRGIVHITIHNSGKYIDIYELYSELEPLLRESVNTTILWENSVEAISYQPLLLDRVERGYFYIILPYDRTLLLQPETTYLYLLAKHLKIAHKKGWYVIMINPYVSKSRRGLFIADATLRLWFGGDEVLVEVLNIKKSELLPVLIK
ncbi:MAG: hypothetical protein ABWW65_01465 [Thermoprotei archaeon]